MRAIRMSLRRRFWRKVLLGDQCWQWIGALDTRPGYGYGYLRLEPDRGSKTATAHRVAWELYHGPIPAGLWVLHHCDNRLCVRPSHLYLGDAKQNKRDAMVRHRHYTKGRPCLTNPSASTLRHRRRLYLRRIFSLLMDRQRKWQTCTGSP